jgi:hypothetical protein
MCEKTLLCLATETMFLKPWLLVGGGGDYIAVVGLPGSPIPLK